MVITEQRREKRAQGEERRGKKSRVKWAHREQQWKKALICTSDFCKLVYHVSSATVPHVPSHSILYMPLLDPTIFCLLPDVSTYSLCQMVLLPALVFKQQHSTAHIYQLYLALHHFMDFFPSFDWMLWLCVKSQYLLLSIKLDWAAGVLKVIRRRKHGEIYAHKKHELTWGPLSPL